MLPKRVLGDPAAACARARRLRGGWARALTDETGAVGMQPFVHAELAQLARARGDEAAHALELSEAQRLFQAIGAPKRAAQLATTI